MLVMYRYKVQFKIVRGKVIIDFTSAGFSVEPGLAATFKAPGCCTNMTATVSLQDGSAFAQMQLRAKRAADQKAKEQRAMEEAERAVSKGWTGPGKDTFR